MATNQELRQAAARSAGGTVLDYNGDMSAMFTAAGIATNLDYNSRFLLWLNSKLSASYTSLPQAQAAFAASKGVARWDDVTAFGASFSLDFTSSMPGGVSVVSSPAGAAIPDSSGNWNTFTANAGRRTDLGLYVEPAATTLWDRSAAGAAFFTLQNATTGGSRSVGNISVTTITESTSTAVHNAFLPGGTFTIATSVSAELFVVQGGRQFHNFGMISSVGTDYCICTFDLTNGTVTQTATIGGYSSPAGYITKFGNGLIWLRVTGNTSTTGCGMCTQAVLTGTPSLGTFGDVPYTGTGLSYEIGGFQIYSNSTVPNMSFVSTNGSQATRTAENIQFTVPAGVTQLTYTFDDNSTQLVSGVSSGTYTIPTTLNRPQIKTIVGGP